MDTKNLFLSWIILFCFYSFPLSLFADRTGGPLTTLDTAWVLSQPDGASAEAVPDFFADSSFSEWRETLKGKRTLLCGTQGPPEEYIQFWLCSDSDGNFVFFYQIFTSGLLSDKAIVLGEFDFAEEKVLVSKRNKTRRFAATNAQLKLSSYFRNNDRIFRFCAEINRSLPPVKDTEKQKFRIEREIELPLPLSGQNDRKTDILTYHTFQTNLVLNLPIGECVGDNDVPTNGTSYALNWTFRMQCRLSPTQDDLDFVSLLPTQPFAHVFPGTVCYGGACYEPYSAVWVNMEWTSRPFGKNESPVGTINYWVWFRGMRQDAPAIVPAIPFTGTIAVDVK